MEERTLLKVGDIIRIRDDIKENIRYRMKLDPKLNNSWVGTYMASAGTLVQIIDISFEQYIVIPADNSIKEGSAEYDNFIFWSYTDEMFDPLMIQVLLEDRYESLLLED